MKTTKNQGNGSPTTIQKPRDTYGSKHFGRTYGMTFDPELEDEECVECGGQAAVVYEDRDGLTHYCNEHDPEAR